MGPFSLWVVLSLSTSASQKALIQVVNKDDGPIELFWEQGGEGSLLGVIEKAQQIPVDTYVGHSFFVTNEAGDKFSFTVEDSVNTVFEVAADRIRRPHQKPAPKHSPPKPPAGRRKEENVLARFLGSHSVKFRNFEDFPVHVYYDDHRGGILQNIIYPGKEIGMNSYIGHSFFFAPVKEKTKRLKEITVHAKEVVYTLEPTPGSPSHDAFIKDKEKQKFLRDEHAFMEKYKKETGVFWRGVYPRAKPVHYMWPADEVGQVHKVVSKHVTTNNARVCAAGDADTQQCAAPQQQVDDGIEFSLEVLCTAPKVMKIPNLLSAEETELIISIAKPRMAASATINKDSGARSSSTAWVQRSDGEQIDRIFRRVADVLKIPEELLHVTRSAEDIQVVHYDVGQEYFAHHDWQASDKPNTRFATLLLYLDTPAEGAGGETGFPLAFNAKGLHLRPPQGHAVLFYDMLADGNVDELSLHAALPVLSGEKWICNFWIWDPEVSV